jgi:hypothetical protein
MNLRINRFISQNTINRMVFASSANDNLCVNCHLLDKYYGAGNCIFQSAMLKYASLHLEKDSGYNNGLYSVL